MKVYPNGSGKYDEPYEILPDFGKPRPVSLREPIARAANQDEIVAMLDEAEGYDHPSARTLNKIAKAANARLATLNGWPR